MPRCPCRPEYCSGPLEWPAPEEVQQAVRAALDESLARAVLGIRTTVAIENNALLVSDPHALAQLGAAGGLAQGLPENGSSVEVVWVAEDVVRVSTGNGEEYVMRREGLTENHLLLGITHRAACLFLEMLQWPPWLFFDILQWPSAYRRDNLPWVDNRLSDRNALVGYDLLEAIRALFQTQRYRAFSVAQVMRAVYIRAGRTGGVRGADAFLSHLQLEKVSTTLRAMRRAIFRGRGWGCGAQMALFVDYFCLKQCKDDFTMERIRIAICSIGTTIVLLDPLTHALNPTFAPDVPSRLWCVFEIYCALLADNPRLEGSLSRSGLLSLKSWGTFHVNARDASTHERRDKERILGEIGENIDLCNSRVGEEVEKALRKASIYGVVTFAVPALIAVQVGSILSGFGRRYARDLDYVTGALSWAANVFGTSVLCIIASKLPRGCEFGHCRMWLCSNEVACLALIISTALTCAAAAVYDPYVIASVALPILFAVSLALASAVLATRSRRQVRLCAVTMPDTTFRLLCGMLVFWAVLFSVVSSVLLFVVHIGFSAVLPVFFFSLVSVIILVTACRLKREVEEGDPTGRRGGRFTDEFSSESESMEPGGPTAAPFL